MEGIFSFFCGIPFFFEIAISYVPVLVRFCEALQRGLFEVVVSSLLESVANGNKTFFIKVFAHQLDSDGHPIAF